MEWVLYSTLGCHLCEEAMDLVRAEGLSPLREVDIADSDEWMQRYGVRIPVLQCVRTGAELGWPFDRAGLARFVAAQ